MLQGYTAALPEDSSCSFEGDVGDAVSSCLSDEGKGLAPFASPRPESLIGEFCRDTLAFTRPIRSYVRSLGRFFSIGADTSGTENRMPSFGLAFEASGADRVDDLRFRTDWRARNGRESDPM